MAQEKESRRDSSKADDYEFIPPDFDEDSFIHKEMVSFRTTLILFVWGIVAALISWAAFAGLHGAMTGWLVGLAICAVLGYSLKAIFPRLKADISHFGKREWLGTAFLFFFTWLAFFILAINPPISDFAPPRVDLHASPFVQQSGAAVTVDLFVEDNEKVSSHTFEIAQGAQPVPSVSALNDLGGGHYQAVYAGLAPGAYTLRASATDSSGHSAESNLTFAVVEDALKVTLPPNATLATGIDQVLVKSLRQDLHPCTLKKSTVTNAPCIRTVQLVFANRAPMDLEFDAKLGGWTATSNFAGWTAGRNNFTVSAQLLSSFAGSVKVPGGNITAGPFTVTVTDSIGQYAAKGVVPDATAHARRIPGLGLPALVAGLVAALAIARRKR